MGVFLEMAFNIDDLKFNQAGLMPAIVQDIESKTVLMLAWMNKEAIQKTLATGETWFYSRSRQKMWHKGETSGHVQKVQAVYYDCDQDTLLVLAQQIGAGACHQGYHSCFHYRVQPEFKERATGSEDQGKNVPINYIVKIEGNQQFDPSKIYAGKQSAQIIDELYQIIQQRQKQRPAGAYTTYLFDQGVDKIGKKIGEEAAEVIIAAKNNDKNELTNEAADLLYHLLVLMAEQGVTTKQLYAELAERRKG